jgi:serine O-acetyltransferase
MGNDSDQNSRQTMAELTERLLSSYYADRRTQHLNSTFLPNRDRVIQAVEILRRLVFPGFFELERLTSDTIEYHAGELLNHVRTILNEQIHQALSYAANRQDPQQVQPPAGGDESAARITAAFLQRLPEVRRVLATDVQAGFEGDPASVNTDEIIFCYPGLDAIFVYRLAHELHKLEVPLLPRIMTEYAHSRTGVDIHPAAQIGESFFIDHASGVVIGETTIIGNRVKIYQGVTLGALSTKGGQAWRGRKRHPTIEDDVTIYPNVTILGGDTIVGRGCTINGSVFLTFSVPPNYTVRVKHPELELRAAKEARGQEADLEVEPQA